MAAVTGSPRLVLLRVNLTKFKIGSLCAGVFAPAHFCYVDAVGNIIKNWSNFAVRHLPQMYKL